MNARKILPACVVLAALAACASPEPPRAVVGEAMIDAPIDFDRVQAVLTAPLYLDGTYVADGASLVARRDGNTTSYCVEQARGTSFSFTQVFRECEYRLVLDPMDTKARPPMPFRVLVQDSRALQVNLFSPKRKD